MHMKGDNTEKFIKETKLISVVVPCYNEEVVIPVFLSGINSIADHISQKYDVLFEYIFINDGSKDGTLDTLRKLRKEDETGRIKYLSFSRNFGKESAMYAGLEASAGDFVAIMDADLQDPPELLETMYLGITEEGYDCVGSRRVTRKGEPKVRSFFSKQFYRSINRMSATPIVDGARDFRLMTRQMVNEILRLSERNRFSKGLFAWVGFDTKWLEYENRERVAGETSWSFWGLLKYSLDGMIAFSTRPLVVASVLGVISCVIALILMIYYFVKALIYGDPVEGFPTLITVILFLGGLQLLCIGILSQYLAKTYTESKGRPLYIIKEKEL